MINVYKCDVPQVPEISWVLAPQVTFQRGQDQVALPIPIIDHKDHWDTCWILLNLVENKMNTPWNDAQSKRAVEAIECYRHL